MCKLTAPFLSIVLLLSAWFVHGIAAGQNEDATEKRQRYLASRFDVQIGGELEKGDQPLLILLEILGPIASVPDAVKDTSLRVTIQINSKAFSDASKKKFDAESITINYPSALPKFTMRMVFKNICQQLNAGYVLRKDHFEILPVQSLRKELNRPNATDDDLRSLVIQFYDKVKLETALKDLAKKHERKVQLSPLAQKELEKPISARLVNLPFETAVEKLADQAGLKLVRKSNGLIVTTKEQAEQERHKEAKR